MSCQNRQQTVSLRRFLPGIQASPSPGTGQGFPNQPKPSTNPPSHPSFSSSCFLSLHLLAYISTTKTTHIGKHTRTPFNLLLLSIHQVSTRYWPRCDNHLPSRMAIQLPVAMHWDHGNQQDVYPPGCGVTSSETRQGFDGRVVPGS